MERQQKIRYYRNVLEKLKKNLDDAPDIIWQYIDSGIVIYCNKRIVEKVGDLLIILKCQL